MMKLSDYTWFAVMTKPRCEQEAKIDLGRLGYVALYLHTFEQIGGGRRMTRLVKRPYLPSYIFVGLRQDQFAGGVPVLGTVGTALGVSTVVRAPGGEPVSIPLRAMERVTAKAELPGGLVHTKKPLLRFAGAPGYAVQFSEENAYQGLMAVISSIDPRGEITVEIESFGRTVPTRISLDDVGQLFDPSGNPVDKFDEPSRTETSAN